MSSSLPVIRQIGWLSVLPQVAVLLLFVWSARALGAVEPFLWGAAIYLLVLVGLRFGIPLHHRIGIRLFKRERFAEAVPHFEKSYEFFSRHRWLDSFRALTLLSSSRISYREMALLNAAFCLAQSGERLKAIEEYRRVLAEFPGSKVSEAALRLVEPPSGSED